MSKMPALATFNWKTEQLRGWEGLEGRMSSVLILCVTIDIRPYTYIIMLHLVVKSGWHVELMYTTLLYRLSLDASRTRLAGPTLTSAGLTWENGHPGEGGSGGNLRRIESLRTKFLRGGHTLNEYWQAIAYTITTFGVWYIYQPFARVRHCQLKALNLMILLYTNIDLVL